MTAIIIIIVMINIMCLNPIHNEFFDPSFSANFLFYPDNRELVRWCCYSW